VAQHTRREFLENAVFGAVGTSVALTTLGTESLAEPQATTAARGYTAGKFGIELDGIMAGWLQSAEGGHATSDVVTQKTGTGPLQQKHIAGVKYEDITVSCGTGMSRTLYEWIKASFENQHVRKNGAITACEYDSREISRVEWTHGQISEVGFPALDAASKDAAKLTVKIAPETTRAVKGSGKPSAGAKLQAVQKKWLPANFRLKIGNLDCTRVNKIEALTIKQKVVVENVRLKKELAMSWKVCPKCKGRATKIVNASTDSVTCQQCDHQYPLSTPTSLKQANKQEEKSSASP